jgi:membrane-bound metal-dependent hydrolase YbcI (DUF457 family)
MPFAGFERLMRDLLWRAGYTNVRLTGRTHKRGRTSKGGVDMMAQTQTELSSCLTAVQIKQYRRVVSRRFVHELRGVMLGIGAEQGLLLTLSAFSMVAHAAAQEVDLAPITLIEGEEVLDLLFAYRLGVVERKGRWRLDATYLDTERDTAIRTYRRGATGKAPDAQATEPQVTNPHYEQSSDPQSNRWAMTWSTHLMAGLNALWLLEALPGAGSENMALLAGAAALGSLLPDLDASESKIKHLSISGIKPFLLPSQAIHRQLGHRSMLHSLVGLSLAAVVSAMLAPFIGREAALALWLGYASHLVADSATRSGIPFLYPRTTRFHLLPKRFRVTTGSPAEDAIFVLLSLSVLALLLRHLGV